MKILATLLLIGATASPVYAGGPRFGGHRSVRYENYCYENVEEFIPGYYNNYGKWVGGYVKNRTNRVPCRNRYVPKVPTYPRNETRYPDVGDIDDNSCVEGSILGGILGGGAGGILSTKENWIWSIPLGVVGGAVAGCQIDGG